MVHVPVRAFVTGAVPEVPDAGTGAELAVEYAKNGSHADLGRALRQKVAAAFTLFALQHPLCFSSRRISSKNFLGNALAIGQIGDEPRPAPELRASRIMALRPDSAFIESILAYRMID